jgi:RNA polymerase sigma-70 factor (ECF subfamily)
MKLAHYSTPKTLNDNEIIERIITGEKYLYEHLMRKYNSRLFRIAMSIINDDMEAEDIMQTAYINAYQQLTKFNHRSSFGTWLTRILINESLLRKKRKNKFEQLLAQHQLADQHNETPLKELMSKELKDILESAVLNLPEKYRLVFVMREIEDMSTNETMEALNIGESNVKIRLNRAKEMLRNELSVHFKSKQLFEFHLTRCDRVVNFVMRNI